MLPTLVPGDRVVVLRPTVDRPLGRGDLVVVDVRGSFLAGHPGVGPLAGVLGGAFSGGRSAEAYVVKRVIGLPGETVWCCDTAGRVVVDGQPLAEPYLAGRRASGEPFRAEVPAGRVWLLGDNRAASRDSRAFPGAPGGGTVAMAAVIGRVATVLPLGGELRGG
jgi:signal peptidase I